MTEFIDKFLCTVAIVMIMIFEFITDIFGISRYMERDRNGIVNNIIMTISMIIFAIPMFIFTKYAKIE